MSIYSSFLLSLPLQLFAFISYTPVSSPLSFPFIPFSTSLSFPSNFAPSFLRVFVSPLYSFLPMFFIYIYFSSGLTLSFLFSHTPFSFSPSFNFFFFFCPISHFLSFSFRFCLISHILPFFLSPFHSAHPYASVISFISILLSYFFPFHLLSRSLFFLF